MTGTQVALPIPDGNPAAEPAISIYGMNSKMAPQVQGSVKPDNAGLPGKIETDDKQAAASNSEEARLFSAVEKAPMPAVRTSDASSAEPEDAGMTPAQAMQGAKAEAPGSVQSQSASQAPVSTQPGKIPESITDRIQAGIDAQTGATQARAKSTPAEVEPDIDFVAADDSVSSAGSGPTTARAGLDMSAEARPAAAAKPDGNVEKAQVRTPSESVLQSAKAARSQAADPEASKSQDMEVDAGEMQGGSAAEIQAQADGMTKMAGAIPANASAGVVRVEQAGLKTGATAETDGEQMAIPVESDSDAANEVEGDGTGKAIDVSFASRAAAQANRNSVADLATSSGEDADGLDTTTMENPGQRMPLPSLSNIKATAEALTDTKNAAAGIAAATSVAVEAQALVDEDGARTPALRGSLRGNRSSRGAERKVASLQAEKTDVAKAAPVLSASEVAEGFASRMVKSLEGDMAVTGQSDATVGVRSRQDGSAQSGLFMGNERSGADAAATGPVGSTMRANFAETLAADRTMRMADRVERLQELIGRIDEHVLSMLPDKGRSMTIQLMPENLGRVSLNCLENGKEIRVEIVVESSSVRTLIQQQESALKEMLTQAGYRLAQFDVRSQSDGANSRQANRNPKNLPGKGRGPELANTETAAVSEMPVAGPMGRAEQVWYIA